MKTLIAIPCMNSVPTEFVMSLIKLKPIGEMDVMMTKGSLIYDARNKLGETAVERGCERILWLDSDMQFKPDTLKCLSDDLDEGKEFVTGLYFKRKWPTSPTIFKRMIEDENGKKGFEPYSDYPRNQVFEIAACGFGAVLMNTAVFRRVSERYPKPFTPQTELGEDLTFCKHMISLGIPMYCDSRVKLGHLGTMAYGEQHYGQWMGLQGLY